MLQLFECRPPLVCLSSPESCSLGRGHMAADLGIAFFNLAVAMAPDICQARFI
jgi:hypothetical protein